MSSKELPKAAPLTIMGVVLVALGVASMATPAVAGKAVVIIIGILMTGAGMLQIVSGFRTEGWTSRLPPLILGLITLVCGLALLAEPWIGMKFIALILALTFIIEGVWKIFASFSYRPASGWLAVLGSGVLSLVLGLMIYQQWPFSGLWAVGLLVGANLLMTGISLIAVASTIRRIHDKVEESIEKKTDA